LSSDKFLLEEFSKIFNNILKVFKNISLNYRFTYAFCRTGRGSVHQRERAAREEQQIARRVALLQEQITSLQNEVLTIRNAATNYVFSQLG
jgi:hypothetical protein